jgi:hypothetical protein
LVDDIARSEIFGSGGGDLRRARSMSQFGAGASGSSLSQM